MIGLKKRKSLVKRILRLTNITTAVTILTMTVILFYIFGGILNSVENGLSGYYANRIEEIVLRSAPEKSSDRREDGYGRIVSEIRKLHETVPYLTVEVLLDDRYIYREVGDIYFTEVLKIEMDEEERFLEDTWDHEIPQNFQVSEFHSSDGEVYGMAIVGIDAKLIRLLHILFVATVIPIAFLLMAIMGLFTRLVVKPIMSPLNELTRKLNRLGDDDFETMAPVLEIDETSVDEVYRLSMATNKVLKKMLDYNEMITQSEKMVSIGQLTAAITHEINTPLGAINSNVGMIRMILDSIPEEEAEAKDLVMARGQIAEAAEMSEDACNRIDNIVTSLKVYSRIDQADFKPADINESLKSVVVLTTNLHKNRIAVESDYGDIPEVMCHIGLMNQVYMNIFINAIQSIEGIGKITVRSWADDDNVYVSIEDTGCGIRIEDMYNIFQYGFTTKQPGSGSGIGLALSSNIIKKHSGKIEVESEVGRGSTFKVTLPVNPCCEKDKMIEEVNYG